MNASPALVYYYLLFIYYYDYKSSEETYSTNALLVIFSIHK